MITAPPNILQKNTAQSTEAHKDATVKGEDWVYVANHAAACTILDVANTPFELATKAIFNKAIPISFCGGCATGKHDTGLFSKDHESVALQAGRWIAAEQIGDWGGAIPTVMLQRYAPNVMNGIGRALTYVVGDAFRSGAERSACNWGAENGLAEDAVEIKQRADEIYSHEIKHIAQAFVWTGFSMGITLASLKVMGDDTPLAVNAAAKMVGMSTSFIGVLGTRALAPEKAQQWDKWGSENIAAPFTRIFGGAFGIENSTVDKVLQENEDYRSGSKLLGKVHELQLSNSLG